MEPHQLLLCHDSCVKAGSNSASLSAVTFSLLPSKTIAFDSALGPQSAEVLSSQWVEKVLAFSSEYSPTSYSAQKVIGPCSTFPAYKDSAETWCHASRPSNSEYLIVKFAEATIPFKFYLYETQNGGACVEALYKNPHDGEFVRFWSGRIGHTTCARKLAINVPEAIRARMVATDTFRFNFCMSHLPGWYELDAIQLVSIDIDDKVDLTSSNPVKSLSRTFGRLFNSRVASDMSFLLTKNRTGEGPVSIPAHRAILSARSGRFSHLLSQGQLIRGVEIVVNDIAADLFISFLRCIYTGSMPDPEFSLSLSQLLKFYEMGEVENQLFQRFKLMKLGLKESLDLFEKAHLVVDPILVASIYSHIRDCVAELASDDSLLESLEKDTLVSLIKTHFS